MRMCTGSHFRPVFWELCICFSNVNAEIQKDSCGNEQINDGGVRIFYFF